LAAVGEHLVVYPEVQGVGRVDRDEPEGARAAGVDVGPDLRPLLDDREPGEAPAGHAEEGPVLVRGVHPAAVPENASGQVEAVEEAADDVAVERRARGGRGGVRRWGEVRLEEV